MVGYADVTVRNKTSGVSLNWATVVRLLLQIGFTSFQYPAFDIARRIGNDMDGTLRVFSDKTKEHRVSHILLPRVSEDRDGLRCRVRGGRVTASMKRPDRCYYVKRDNIMSSVRILPRNHALSNLLII